jgi:hypothetical protein
MHLILHIGTAKTGTTSLQVSLASNRRALARRGVLYPEPPAHRVNHNLLTTLLGPSVRVPREFLEMGDEASLRKLGQRYWDGIRREVARSAANVVVISGEYFYGLPGEGVARLRELLADLAGDDIEVACYLRGPAEYYVSMMQQQVKASHTVQPPSRFQWRAAACLTRYLETFSAPLVVRSAERPALVQGDVRRDFVQTFLPQIDLGGPITRAPILNESMSAEAMCILQAVRRRGWPDEDGRFAPESNRLVAALNGMREGSPLQSSPELRADIRDAFVRKHAADLRFVEERFGIRFASVADDGGRAEPDPPPGWDSGELCEILEVDPDDVRQLTYDLLKVMAERPPLTAVAADYFARGARRLARR